MGGGIEFWFPFSKVVCRGFKIGSITGSSNSSGADAMTNSFISLVSWVARSKVGGSRERYRSFTLKVFPAAMNGIEIEQDESIDEHAA